MTRHFTRQQVEARCLQIHPNSSEDETTRILSVGLLDVLDPFPLWRVEYVKIYKEHTPHKIQTALTDIYQEVKIGERLVLLPIPEKPLPIGCASVEEEDKAMEVRV